MDAAGAPRNVKYPEANFASQPLYFVCLEFIWNLRFIDICCSNYRVYEFLFPRSCSDSSLTLDHISLSVLLFIYFLNISTMAGLCFLGGKKWQKFLKLNITDSKNITVWDSLKNTSWNWALLNNTKWHKKKKDKGKGFCFNGYVFIKTVKQLFCIWGLQLYLFTE